MSNMDEELLEELYVWVDEIPLSRPKKNIQRDFSDGVLIAEIVRHYCPRIVEIHNYVAASRTDKKLTNWSLLNRKVFKKLGFEITDDVMQNIVNCKPMAVEQFLMMLRRKIDRFVYEFERDNPRRKRNDRPEADQNMEVENSYSPHLAQMAQMTNNSKTGQPQPSNRDLSKQAPVPPIGGGVPKPGGVTAAGSKGNVNQYNKNKASEYVPKMAVEEKEQEILAKDETIQILTAKVRRLEHLLHLKDIRIDDLQSRLDRMGMELRPTAKYKK